jgi:hypothetical protein
LNPLEPKYAFTPAFYQKAQRDLKAAAATRLELLAKQPAFTDGYLLLAEVNVQQGEHPQAKAVLRQAQQVESLSPRDRARVDQVLQKLSNP